MRSGTTTTTENRIAGIAHVNLWPAMLLFVVLGFAPARAQDDPDYRGTAEQQIACTGDAFRICWNAIPVVDRIVACLRSNRSQLSPACRAVFDQDSPRYSRRLRRHHRRDQS